MKQQLPLGPCQPRPSPGGLAGGGTWRLPGLAAGAGLAGGREGAGPEAEQVPWAALRVGAGAQPAREGLAGTQPRRTSCRSGTSWEG